MIRNHRIISTLISKKFMKWMLLVLVTCIVVYINYGINIFYIGDFYGQQYTTSHRLFEFVPRLRIDKLYDLDYRRSVVELLTYIPIGLLVCNSARKNKIRTSLVYSVVVSIYTGIEICSGWSDIYYLKTIMNNCLGTCIGISVFYTAKLIEEKGRMRKIPLYLLPLFIGMLYCLSQYMVCYTNRWGNVYPNDYVPLSPECLNVTYSDEYEYYTVDPSLYSMLTKEDTKELIRRLFESVGVTEYSIETGYDGIRVCEEYWQYVSEDGRYIIILPKGNSSLQLLFLDMLNYEGDDRREMETRLECDSEEFKGILDALKNVGIIFKPNKNNEIYRNNKTREVLIQDATSFEDDIYIYHEFRVKVDEEGKLKKLRIESDVWHGWSLRYRSRFKSGNEKFSSFYNPEELDNVVTEDMALEKLCNGECYADGLNEAVKNGSVDIVIYNSDIKVQRDDRGYMEYVYCFYIEPITAPDGTVIDMLYVPALKSYY